VRPTAITSGRGDERGGTRGTPRSRPLSKQNLGHGRRHHGAPIHRLRAMAHPLSRVRSGAGAGYLRAVAGRIACKDASRFEPFSCPLTPPSTFDTLRAIARRRCGQGGVLRQPQQSWKRTMVGSVATVSFGGTICHVDCGQSLACAHTLSCFWECATEPPAGVPRQDPC